jgi:hypothetical protein
LPARRRTRTRIQADAHHDPGCRRRRGGLALTRLGRRGGLALQVRLTLLACAEPATDSEPSHVRVSTEELEGGWLATAAALARRKQDFRRLYVTRTFAHAQSSWGKFPARSLARFRELPLAASLGFLLGHNDKLRLNIAPTVTAANRRGGRLASPLPPVEAKHSDVVHVHGSGGCCGSVGGARRGGDSQMIGWAWWHTWRGWDWLGRALLCSRAMCSRTRKLQLYE